MPDQNGSEVMLNWNSKKLLRSAQSILVVTCGLIVMQFSNFAVFDS